MKGSIKILVFTTRCLKRFLPYTRIQWLYSRKMLQSHLWKVIFNGILWQVLMNINLDMHVQETISNIQELGDIRKQLPYASRLISQPKDCTNSFDSMTFEKNLHTASAHIELSSTALGSRCFMYQGTLVLTLVLINSPVWPLTWVRATP